MDPRLLDPQLLELDHTGSWMTTGSENQRYRYPALSSAPDGNADTGKTASWWPPEGHFAYAVLSYLPGGLTPPSLSGAPTASSSPRQRSTYATISPNLEQAFTEHGLNAKEWDGGYFTNSGVQNLVIREVAPSRNEPAQPAKRGGGLSWAEAPEFHPQNLQHKAALQQPIDVQTWAQGHWTTLDRANQVSLPPTPPSSASVEATALPNTQRTGWYHCPHENCGKEFAKLSDLAHHRRYHLHKRCLCTLCGASFYFNKDLKRHIKIHSPNERHIMCNVLGCPYSVKGFQRKDHLQRHMIKVHNRTLDDKPISTSPTRTINQVERFGRPGQDNSTYSGAKAVTKKPELHEETAHRGEGHSPSVGPVPRHQGSRIIPSHDSHPATRMTAPEQLLSEDAGDSHQRFLQSGEIEPAPRCSEDAGNSHQRFLQSGEIEPAPRFSEDEGTLPNGTADRCDKSMSDAPTIPEAGDGLPDSTTSPSASHAPNLLGLRNLHLTLQDLEARVNKLLHRVHPDTITATCVLPVQSTNSPSRGRSIVRSTQRPGASESCPAPGGRKLQTDATLSRSHSATSSIHRSAVGDASIPCSPEDADGGPRGPSGGGSQPPNWTQTSPASMNNGHGNGGGSRDDGNKKEKRDREGSRGSRSDKKRRKNDVPGRPCIVRVGDETKCDSSQLYPHISDMLRHLRRSHNIIVCQFCITPLPDSEAESQHSRRPCVKHDRCQRKGCKRKYPQSVDPMPANCACMLHPDDQWRELYSLEFKRPPPPLADVIRDVTSSGSSRNATSEVTGSSSRDNDLQETTSEMQSVPPHVANLVPSTWGPRAATEASLAEGRTLTQAWDDIFRMQARLRLLEQERVERAAAEAKQATRGASENEDLRMVLGMVWQALLRTGSADARVDSPLTRLVSKHAPDILRRDPPFDPTIFNGPDDLGDLSFHLQDFRPP